MVLFNAATQSRWRELAGEMIEYEAIVHKNSKLRRGEENHDLDLLQGKKGKKRGSPPPSPPSGGGGEVCETLI